VLFFFSSRRRHTRCYRDWSSDVCSSDLGFINCTASIGGFVGPKIFGDLSQRTGSFNTGFAVMIACWIIASLLVLVCPRERAEVRSEERRVGKEWRAEGVG